MVLECTILILDNSQHSINGDYHPTRYAAQQDAMHIIFNNKCQSNPENQVGLILMGGKTPEVLVTPTQDEGKLIKALHDSKQGGEAHLQTAIQVAQLALKHRQNKNQRQRIIVFVGSPLEESSLELIKLGKKMKKNNVSIDIISFGTSSTSATSLPPLLGPSTSSLPLPEIESNQTKLESLHEAVNSTENTSHILFVEPGLHLLSEKISSSAILRGEDVGESGGEERDGEVDGNLDPELAMALRMSLEEERARLAALAAATAPAASTLPVVPTTTALEFITPVRPVPHTTHEQSSGDISMTSTHHHNEEGEEEEDDDLARALAMSRGDDVDMQDREAEEGGEEDEDEEIQRAIALSMKEEEEEEK